MEAVSAPRTSTVADDVRSIAWWLLVGAAAGAVAGFVIGGVGGRLAMLLLRLTSPESVIGVISDDGFEIGVVTTKTFSLLFGMTMLGAANGVLYAAVRSAIPRRLRVPLWAGFAATVGGATFVSEDGVDFTLLEPAALAIALFVALPGIAAAVIVVLVERWVVAEPWANRRTAVLYAGAAVVGTFALVLAAAVGVAALAIRRSGGGPVVARVARIVVPIGLIGLGLWGGFNLVTKAARII